MPALLLWIIRIVGIAFVARRAMRGARQIPRSTTERGRPGSLSLPDPHLDIRGALAEVHALLRETFWSLASRDLLVLGVGAAAVGLGVAIVLRLTTQ